MTLDDYAKSLLACVMWREARGDGLDAMRAVGHVVMNRAKAWYGGDVVKAIVAPEQFSSMTICGDSQTVIWPPWSDLFATAETIYNGMNADNTQGALYYDNPKTATSGWFKRIIADDPIRHPLLATIGQQNFYK